MSASATVSMQAKDQPPLLQDIHRWMEAFLQPTVLIELAALLACLGLAWFFVAVLQRGVSTREPLSILFGRRILDGVLFPLVWLGLAYISLFSMLIGFVFWYRGLAEGGVAAVGQLQLLQPFFGLALAASLLHEPVGWSMAAVTLAVVVCVAGAKRFA